MITTAIRDQPAEGLRVWFATERRPGRHSPGGHGGLTFVVATPYSSWTTTVVCPVGTNHADAYP
jgi:hypothetical protein